MTAYRFCRSDDIGLLVDALNRSWPPYFPDEPLMTPAAFKRSIRDLQVWCSSCMVAFAGSDPIGVLIGAKRPSGTLVHRIAVHPDHAAAGSWPSLADLAQLEARDSGPPSNRRRSPRDSRACLRAVQRKRICPGSAPDRLRPRPHGATTRRGSPGQREEQDARTIDGRFVIPVTVDDLAANGLLEEAHPQVCWERSVETLTARKDDIAGLAVASDERIEAYLLYAKPAEILSLRSFVDDGGARLRQLLSRLGPGTFRFPKVHPEEISKELLETLGFRPAAGHLLYAARARSD